MKNFYKNTTTKLVVLFDGLKFYLWVQKINFFNTYFESLWYSN